MSKTVIASRKTVPGTIDKVERIEVVRTPCCTSGSGAMASDKAAVHEVSWRVTLSWRPEHIRPWFGARIRNFKSRKAAMSYFDNFNIEVTTK